MIATVTAPPRPPHKTSSDPSGVHSSLTSVTMTSSTSSFVDEYNAAVAADQAQVEAKNNIKTMEEQAQEEDNHQEEANTLYERMGGEKHINQLTHEFFVEIAQQDVLQPFFVNVPVEAIQFHQGKFFKVLFGPEEEKPTPDELLDYMIHTHVRLFRDMGLDEQHFDIVAGCFCRALNTCQVTPDLQQECLAIVGPLRDAFEYGAIVAEREKDEQEENSNSNSSNKNNDNDSTATPIYATMETMRQNRTDVVLPPGLPPPPQWLVQKPMRGQREQVLRAWTCALTRRFTVQDATLSHTFTALAYLDMEPYLHSFLALAFLEPDSPDVSPQEAHKILRAVRFPLGISKAKSQLTQPLWVKMVQHFEQVGMEMIQNAKPDMIVVPVEEIQAAVARLQKLTSSFIDPTRALVGSVDGWETSHKLRHEHKQENNKKEREDSSSSSYDGDDTSSVSSHSSKTSTLSSRSGLSSVKSGLSSGRKINKNSSHGKSAQRKVQFAEQKRSGTKNSIWGWLRGRKDRKGRRTKA